MSAYDRTVHKARGSERVTKILLSVGAAHAASGTDYHVITATLVPVGEEIDLGATIGEALSTATRALTAGDQETLYDDEDGTLLTDGDRIVVKRSKTGNPAALVDAKIAVERQRIVR